MNASELATLGNAMLERSSIPVKFEFICDSLGSLYRVISIIGSLSSYIKLEDLPGCAVQMGSVGGHIECKNKTNFWINKQIIGNK